MTDIKKLEEDEMNRRTLLAVLSAIGIATAPKTWTKPAIDSIILPAHAQTSCSMINDVDIIGDWRFTDQHSVTVDIQIIDDSTINFDNRPVNNDLSRASDGTLIFEIRNPAAPWQGNITQEADCIASEITITIAPTSAGTYKPPLVGQRI